MSSAEFTYSAARLLRLRLHVMRVLARTLVVAVVVGSLILVTVLSVLAMLVFDFP